MPLPVQTRASKVPYVVIALVILILVVGGLVRVGFLHMPGLSHTRPLHVPVKVAKNNSPVALGNFANGFA